MWDLFYDADSVRAMLTKKIQEESLRTYLFTYSNTYDSISIVSTSIERRSLKVTPGFFPGSLLWCVRCNRQAEKCLES